MEIMSNTHPSYQVFILSKRLLSNFLGRCLKLNNHQG